jgi:2-polyprenyl-3-methyl-5-hydroxy-6-metoxy-1,4-benzoquinol methylase
VSRLQAIAENAVRRAAVLLRRVDPPGRLRALSTSVRIALGRREEVQRESDEFWRTSTTTYLAPPEYYDRRQRLIEELMPDLGPVATAVDVGCGDGRFTLVLARYAKSVVGYDIAPDLIAQARTTAAAVGADHVAFEVAELAQIPLDRRFDLVSCMGVTSCVVDRRHFEALLDRLRELVAPRGLLVMVDSLVDSRERTSAYRNGYVAQYRNAQEYVASVRRRGFAVRSRHVVETWSGLTNQLIVFTAVARD